MKRFLTGLLALALLLPLTVPARADLIWEPRDNQFYEDHRDQCEYVNRGYFANGKEGFVTLWDAPGGGVVREQYENGTELRVYFTCRDWGLVASWVAGQEFAGWVPMSDLYLIYDHISFEEEYGGQFRDYGGEFADYVPGQERETFPLWEYPYDYSPTEHLFCDQDILDALRGTADQPSCISRVYTDQNGQNWGYVGYLYGRRNFWLLLDNPTCEGIMTSCIPEAEDLITAGRIVPPREPAPPGPTARSVLPYILVAAAVGATGGILVFFYGKRKKSTD